MYDQHIILDFEMNPVSKANKNAEAHLYREIIEIGAVKLNEKYEITDKFSCLIKPQLNDKIERRITRLTGITFLDVCLSLPLEQALAAFSRWIGRGKTRVYSWGGSDFTDLKAECDFKGIALPENMQRWMNFQPIYLRLMKLENKKQQMSLEHAAQWYGMEFDDDKAHRALYDAKITARLVQSVLTGDYIKQVEIIGSALNGQKELKVSMGDICGNALAKLLERFPANAG